MSEDKKCNYFEKDSCENCEIKVFSNDHIADTRYMADMGCLLAKQEEERMMEDDYYNDSYDEV